MIMADIEEASNGIQEPNHNSASTFSLLSLSFLQKLIAEFVGTYFLIYAGCASVVLNLEKDNVVTLPGIAMVWGLTVMVLVYTVGHISGAHFNPAVTIAFATSKKFPWKQVPAYVAVQIVGSMLASISLRLLFSGKEDQFVGTIPSGSSTQSFVIEFIITFYLMFVISSVATDDRAIGQFAGVAIGGIISINVLSAGPVTGASMNPARSLGPAIVWKHYRGLWIYIIAPVLGAISGAWTYNFIRFTHKSLSDITKNACFLNNKITSSN